MLQPWQRVEPTIVTKIDRRTVVLKTFVQPDDERHVFGTWHGEGGRAAGIIALTTDNKVIIARQFRPGPEKIMDEIPGGAVESEEEPEAGACRELLEETGYIPGKLEFLGTSSRDAYTNATWFYYLATDCKLSPGGQQLEEHEYVEVHLFSIDEFIKAACEDRMTDPAAVLMAYERLKELQQEGV